MGTESGARGFRGRTAIGEAEWDALVRRRRRVALVVAALASASMLAAFAYGDPWSSPVPALDALVGLAAAASCGGLVWSGVTGVIVPRRPDDGTARPAR